MIDRLDKCITVRCSEKELEDFKQAADDNGLRLSQFMRLVVRRFINGGE